MTKFLNLFYKFWIGLVIFLNLLGLVGTAYTTQSFTETLSYLQTTYSPFNIWTYLLNLFLLLPAIGAYYWLKKRTND